MKIIFTILITCFLLINKINSQHNWTRTNPGGGGAIAVVKASPNGTIYAASDLSGVYKSVDNGQTWTVIGANQGIEETHISALGFDPTNDAVFFAGTYLGLYKTTDAGVSFNQVFPTANDSFDYSYIEDVAIAASNPNIGYLTHHESPDSFGEIYKTTDGGNSWAAVINSNLPNNLHLIKIMIHPTNADIVYVLSGKSRWGCSEANLYKSVDGGVNWFEIGSSQGEILDFDLHSTDTNIVFISTFLSNYSDSETCKTLSLEEYLAGDEFSGAFYKSIDGGVSFNQLYDKTGIISVGINNPNIIRLLDIFYPYDWNDNAGTWETQDGGNTWNHTGFVTSWEKGYTEEQYFVFTPSFNGFSKTVTKDIFNADNFYGAFGQWAWGSFDGGVHLDNISTTELSSNHWLSTGLENINGHCVDVNDTNSNVIYIGGYDIGFWYSTDHGFSWTRTQPDYNIYPEYSWNLGTAGTIPTNLAKRGAGANVMTLLNDPDRENVIWASFSIEQYSDENENTLAKTGLFKSDNYGEDWVLIENGLPAFDESIRMYGLSLDKSSSINNRTMFLTVDGDVYRSLDDGLTWSLVLTGHHLKFTEVDKINGNNVYAGGKDGLWKSTDSGGNWIEIGTSAMHSFNTNTRPDIVPTWTNWDGSQIIYPWEGVFDIETDPNIPNRIYVSVLSPNGGLFKSDDGGNTWQQLIFDSDMRGVAVAPENSNIVYTTSSKSYHSGGYGNSLGILYSTDAGQNWEAVNTGMAYNYAGMIEVEHGNHPYVWVWSPGTGMQKAEVPYFENLSIDENVFNEILYPNPTSDKLVIPTNFINCNYTVFTSLGKKVAIGKANHNLIYLSDLKKGLYFILLQNNNKISKFKFIKD